jgi:hypothetical protein
MVPPVRMMGASKYINLLFFIIVKTLPTVKVREGGRREEKMNIL